MLWGWRVPFLLSAALVIIGMVIRLKLEESDDMKRLMQQKKTVKMPILEVLRNHWQIVLLGAGVLPIIHVTYFKSTFALSWATKELGYAQSTFLSVIVVSLVIQFIAQPFGAVLVSKIDMRKAVAMMIIPELILMPAMFFAVETKVYWIAVVGMCLATIPHSMFYGAVGGILARAFPTKVRYSGLSISYQLCSLLVGGATPVLAQGILNSTGSIVGVAIASASYALVSLVCMLLLLKRIGHNASDLSTAERADADERVRDELNLSTTNRTYEGQRASGVQTPRTIAGASIAPD
jgi:MFS family permease